MGEGLLDDDYNLFFCIFYLCSKMLCAARAVTNVYSNNSHRKVTFISRYYPDSMRTTNSSNEWLSLRWGLEIYPKRACWRRKTSLCEGRRNIKCTIVMKWKIIIIFWPYHDIQNWLNSLDIPVTGAQVFARDSRTLLPRYSAPNKYGVLKAYPM